MNDSKNEKNDINKRPIYAIRRARADIENATLGAIIGGMFLIVGLIALFKNPQIGLFSIALSVFPICEVFRGSISFKNKTIISNPQYPQSEELKKQAESNDKKLKLISKIKIIDFIIILLMIITLIIIKNF